MYESAAIVKGRYFFSSYLISCYFPDFFRLFGLISRFVGAMYTLSVQYELLPRQGPQSFLRVINSHGGLAFPSGSTKSVYKV